LNRLLSRADVLVENFRPGTLARQGLDYPSLHASHPRLIYASLSGYGHTGPRAQEPGYDAVLQGEGGLMSLTGAADGPPFRLGVAVADIVTGLFAVQGILLALVARQQSGRGQHVDVAMLDSVAALLTYQAANWFATARIPPRQGNRHATIAPYETFTTKDGDIVIAVGNDPTWQKFCPAIGLSALANDPRFTTNKDRMEHYEAMRPPIDAAFRTKTSAEWIAILNAAGVANGAVRDIGQMLNDPQLAAREMVQTLMHPTVGATRVIGAPIKFSENAATVRTPPPILGQHTDAVLSEIGYDSAAIAALRDKGVI